MDRKEGINVPMKQHKHKGWLILVLLGVLAGVYAVWHFELWKAFYQPKAAESDSAYQTSAAWRGDIAISTNGSGTVIATAGADLSFRSAGTVGSLNVAVGDTVTKGEVLSVLADTRPLELAVKKQQVALEQAKQSLAELQAGAERALAQAKADLASTQAAYQDALNNLHQEGEPRCPENKTEGYYKAYLVSLKPVEIWESALNDPDTGYGYDYIMEHLNQYRKTRDAAYASWKYCEGYTADEIQKSEAALQLADAELALAKQNYDDLIANGGIDTVALAIAQTALENAQLQLEKAQRDLEGASITAPIDGTVVAINGEAGDEVGTETFITLTDMRQIAVQLNTEEADLAYIAVNCPAVVTFDSLPGATYNGTIRDIAPALVNASGVSYVQSTVDLQTTKTLDGSSVLVGLAANVEVSCQSSSGALLVPAQSLYHDEAGGSYVYVLDGQGLPEKREVSVGLETVATAEILRGLSDGERVVISSVESPSAAGLTK